MDLQQWTVPLHESIQLIKTQLNCDKLVHHRSNRAAMLIWFYLCYRLLPKREAAIILLPLCVHLSVAKYLMN